MKKVLFVLFIALFSFSLFACNNKQEEKKYEFALDDSELQVSLFVGEEHLIKFTSTNVTLTWEVADTTIVSVKDSLITALKAGETNITIKVNEKDDLSKTIKVVVKEKEPTTVLVKSIACSFDKTLTVDDEEQLVWEVLPNDADNKEYAVREIAYEFPNR